MNHKHIDEELWIPLGDSGLQGDLILPERTKSLVIFAHGSGSSRFSPRNRQVAHYLNQQGLGTLLFDLLTADEEAVDQYSREFRFNIPLLAQRLSAVTDWLVRESPTKSLHMGYFGASTGAAAALIAATRHTKDIAAVVSRGGRPDLAGDYLTQVTAPTLLIVGGFDEEVIMLNEEAKAQLVNCHSELEIVPEATHLFEEAGKLEQVCRLTSAWFLRYLA